MSELFIWNASCVWEAAAICQIVVLFSETQIKLVKVDVLRGDGVHAEELHYNFTAGRRMREEPGNKKGKEKELEVKVVDYNNQIKTGSGRRAANEMWIWSCWWIWKRAETGMLLGGSVKELKVSAAGEFRYTSAKASDRTSPPLLFRPPSSRPAAHIKSDANLTVKHLWQRICGSEGTACLLLCSSAISFPRPG